MIVSASYKTDIPAFYGDWFMNRLDAGFCMMVNPYNGRAIRVSLTRADVDGLVFWTKNVGPFLGPLGEVHRLGYPFVVQYSINAYPRTLEYSVVNAGRSIDHMRRLSEQFGSRVPVWRYDPIIFSSITPLEFHIDNFDSLASQLDGATDEVVVSFAQIYRKTRLNMDWAGREFGFSWTDPDDSTKSELVAKLAQVAAAHRMQLTMCSQPEYVSGSVRESRCVDVERLSDVGGQVVRAKQEGNRPTCGCYASRDIGDYDTCPHGCVYCYAVRNRRLAQQRYREHDPNAEFLFLPHKDVGPSHVGQVAVDEQLVLFNSEQAGPR